MRSWVGVVVALLVVALGASAVSNKLWGGGQTVVVQAARGHAPVQTIYIRNLSPRFYTDREILDAIPAWEHAVNHDFALYWNTPQYRLVFLGRRKAPGGASVATFVKSGPVKGALAFHDVEDGAPAITVYSGTAAYYGYDNSVSFTHELFELAADPTICVTNQGWPYDWIWLEKPDGMHRVVQQEGLVWAQEVADPVEADYYLGRGADGKRTVKVSDFVTPNWFNDGMASAPYDFMMLLQQPFTVRPGGYGQFWDGLSWSAVTNFRAAVPSDRGFWLGDGREVAKH